MGKTDIANTDNMTRVEEVLKAIAQGNDKAGKNTQRSTVKDKELSQRGHKDKLGK